MAAECEGKPKRKRGEFDEKGMELDSVAKKPFQVTYEFIQNAIYMNISQHNGCNYPTLCYTSYLYLDFSNNVSQIVCDLRFKILNNREYSMLQT